MQQQHLVRQRIKYLVEYGGLYPAEEPATKNFVFRWALVLLGTNLVQIALTLME